MGKLTPQELGMWVGDLDLRWVRHSDNPQSKGVISQIKMKEGTSTLVVYAYFNGRLDQLEIKSRLLVSAVANERSDILEVRLLRKASSPKGYSLVFYNEEG